MIKKADSVSLLILSAFLFLTASVGAFAQDSNSPRFTENKGQWPNQVAYKLRVSNADIYFEKDRLTFDFLRVNLTHAHAEHTAELPEARFAYSVQFVGSSQNVKTISSGEYGDYQNYLLGADPTQWASKVKSYTKMSYLDLYPGINLNYYQKDGHLKYDVVIAANADPSQYKMKFDGVENIKLKNGKLVISNPLNTVTELAPVAFQTINGKKVEVACSFKLRGNQVSFVLPNGYDKSRQLVIDPTLIFASYTGSTANNFGFTATYDDAGSLYGGGLVYGMGYPFVTGSFQEIFGGGRDIGVSKFSPDGSNLIYSTFVGGANVEIPNSMIVNSQGQLVILATTGSSDFPVTPLAVDNSFNGGTDIDYPSNGTHFTAGTDIGLIVLSADGSSLIGGTYLGGAANDGLNMDGELLHNYGDQFRGEVIVDSSDNIYVASSTLSSDFPVTGGVVSSSLGGTQDGCLAKYNPNLTTLVWCTYFGGSQADASYSVKLNSSQELYVTGGTRSSNFPADGGAMHPTFQGGSTDGYVARISNNGTTLINSSFVGTSGFDQSYFVEIDASDEVYLYGQALGNYPLTGGVYSNPGSGQFIQKMSPNLSTSLFSTVFGSGAGTNISPTAFLVDVCQRVYISGWGGTTNIAGGNTNGMPLSNDAFQATTDGSDFYFAVFEADATNLLYATYFGGSNSAEHVDGGTSRFDRNGAIYQAVCSACGNGNDFPVTTGAWSEIDGSGSGCNLGVIKLDMDLIDVNVNINANGAYQGCTPFTVDFESTIINATSVTWDFGDNTTSNLTEPTHIFTAPGVYNVTLIGNLSGFCSGGQFADTASIQVTVNESLINANAGIDSEACSAQAVTIGVPAVSGVVYSWSPALGLNLTNVAQPEASPGVLTQYILTTTDANGCEDQDTVIVDVFSVEASQDALVCEGESTQLSATGGSSWVWSPATNLNNPIVQNPLATMATTTTFTVLADNGFGCQATDQVTVTVNPLPTANAGADQSLCANDSVQLSASGGGTYSWNPASGLSNSNIANPMAFPENSTVYELLVTDGNGCQDEDSITVMVLPPPLVVASPDTMICLGDSVQLSVTGAVTYLWSPLAGLIDPNDQPLAAPTEPITYVVVGEDANGCKATDSVVVNLFSIVAGPDTTLCVGDSVQVFVDGGVSYQWSPAESVSDPTSAHPFLYAGSNNQFEVTATSDRGCVDQATVTLTTLDPPMAEFNASPIPSCEGVEINFENQSQNARSYFWDFGDGTTDSTFNTTHEFPAGNGPIVFLIATNNDGLCADTFKLDMSNQLLGMDTLRVTLGNVISPNFDGYNDCFQPLFNGEYSDCYQLEVYNRWGNLLFESVAGTGHCWDGRTKAGTVVSKGTYYYIVRINDFEKAGWVAVVD